MIKFQNKTLILLFDIKDLLFQIRNCLFLSLYVPMSMLDWSSFCEFFWDSYLQIV